MHRLIVLILLLPISLLAQTFEQEMQGSWVSIGLRDSASMPTVGEFGTPRNFLKFQIEANKLFISLSPFDKGTPVRIAFGEDNFSLINSPLTQKSYTRTQNSNDTIVLETKTRAGKSIYYYFVNQRVFAKDLEYISKVRSYEKLTIEMTYVKSALGFYMSSYYLIDNSILNLLPSPLFIDNELYSLGAYLEANIRIPMVEMVSLSGKETVFEFDVTNAGIENIAIQKTLGMDIDFQIYDIIKSMEKKWKAVTFNGKTYDTRINIKLAFSFKEK